MRLATALVVGGIVVGFLDPGIGFALLISGLIIGLVRRPT